MRTLPENTVDAWTAVHLAWSGAHWIWLPTPRQGKTREGSHPGDISFLAGRRLVLIENKGIEDDRRIDFGSQADQLTWLKEVEETGLRMVSGQRDFPCLGWVFYGLPMPNSGFKPTGLDWPAFPCWHRLVCPHAVTDAGLRGNSKRVMSNLSFNRHEHCTGQHHQTPCIANSSPHPMHLGDHRPLINRNLIGLPIDQRDPRGFVTSLTRSVRSLGAGDNAGELDQGDDSGEFPFEELLSLIARGSRHLIGFV